MIEPQLLGLNPFRGEHCARFQIGCLQSLTQGGCGIRDRNTVTHYLFEHLTLWERIEKRYSFLATTKVVFLFTSSMKGRHRPKHESHRF